MSAIDDALAANAGYATTLPPSDARPRKQLAILTCMDSRLDLFAALGLHLREAHLIRNAGGLPTPDTLRSLAISQRALGTREIAVIQHTNCGMYGFDDPAFRAELTLETGDVPPWNVSGFHDLTDSVRHSVAAIRACPWLPHRDQVRGFTFDVDTQQLSEVS